MSNDLQVIKQTVSEIKNYLSPELKATLPAHVTPEKFFSSVSKAIIDNPKLLDADRRTLYSAVLKAAEVGLEINSALGHAYLIPFKGKITFIPGYRGLMDLARRGGDVKSFSVQEVRENDDFVVEFGKEGFPFSHRPRLSGDRGEPTFLWCMATFKDGTFHWDFMSIEDIKKIQAAAPSAKAFSSPWKTHFIEMAKKTIVRRVCKMLPVSTQRLVESAVEMENSSYEKEPEKLDHENVFDVTPQEVDPKTEINEQEEIKMQELIENAETIDQLKSYWVRASVEFPSVYQQWNEVKEKRKLELAQGL